MGILYEQLDDEAAFRDLGKACLTEASCGTCAKEKCLIGYAKSCLSTCVKNKVTYVMDGMDNIPGIDAKVYDEERLADGIAGILKICRSCEEEHFDNCIINVIRSCYEVLLFGNEREYHGSAFAYLTELSAEGQHNADLVVDAYNNRRKE